MSQIDKWREARRPGRGMRGGRPKANPEHAQLHSAPSLPKSSTMHDLRVEGDVDLSIFDDLQPDQDWVINPTGVADGDVLVAVAPEIAGNPPTWTTAAPPNLPSTDGLAPTNIPTNLVLRTTGNAIIANWTGISNPDDVTYQVHVSPVNGFTPDATTLLGTVKGTSFTIRAWPVGTVGADGHTYPDYDEPVYARIVPADEDGVDYATASTQAVSSFVQIDTPDIFAGAVHAEQLTVDEGFFDAINAGLLSGNKLIIGDPASQHIEGDADGLRLIQSDQTVKVNLPTGADDPAVFRGQVIADDLAVLNQAVFQGDANVMDQGSVLTLADSLGSPGQAPGVELEWPGLTTAGNPDAPGSVLVTGGWCFWSDGSGAGGEDVYLRLCMYNNAAHSVYVEEYLASDGSFSRSTRLDNKSAALGFDVTDIEVYGITAFGSNVYVLLFNEGLGRYEVWRLGNVSTFLTITSVVGVSALGTSTRFALGHNAAEDRLLMAAVAGTDTSRDVYPYNPATGLFDSVKTLTGGASRPETSWDIVGVVEADSGYWIAWKNTTSASVDHTEKYNTGTLAYIANNDFYTDNVGANKLCGFFHDGSNFLFCRAPTSSGPTIRRWSNWTWTTESSHYWWGYLWTDGTHTTKLSPLGDLSMVFNRRAFVRITLPPMPNSITATRIYSARSASEPALTDMLRQTTATYIDSETSTSVQMKNFNAAGTANPNTNDFGAGNSEIDATASLMTSPWKLKGDGRMILPRVTAAQRDSISSPEEGLLVWNTTAKVVEYYDGTAWKVATQGRYVYVGAAFSKGASGTSERTVMESANNLPTTATPAVANKQGASYRITVAGLYNHASAGGTLTVRLKIGSTTIDSYNIAAPGSNQANQAFALEGVLTVKTVGASGVVSSRFSRYAGGNATAYTVRGSGDVTVDLTASAVIDATIQYGSSSSNNGVTIDTVVVERIA